MKPTWMILLALGVLLVLPALLHADHVHLKNGKVLRGEVVKEDGETVTVRLPQGTVTLRRSQIERIEKESSQDYQLGMAREQIARGRYLLVIQELEKNLRRNPDQAELTALLARAYGEFGNRLLKARRMSEAAACYKRLNELQPDSEAATAGLKALADEGQKLERLLARARQAVAEGNYAAAVREYEAALKFSPDVAEHAASELALCLARYAEGQLRHEKYAEAAGLLERAFALDPALAGRLENLYAAAALNDILRRLEPGKADQVQDDVARALSFAPSHPAVLYVAGRLEEARRDFRAASAYYARGLDVTPSRATAGRLSQLREKLEKSLGVTGEALRLRLDPVDEAVYAEAKAGAFDVLPQPGFIIHHYNSSLAREVARNLDAQLGRIQSMTGLRVDWTRAPVKVFIHRTQEEYVKQTGQAAWTGGMTRFAYVSGRGARNLEFHSWQTSPRLLKSVLPHELMHLVMASNMKRHESLPRAVHEGFAVLMEPSFRHSHFLNFLKRRIGAQAYLPLADLLKMKDYPRDPELFYAEGFAFIAFLIQEVGMQRTMSLIQSTPEPVRFEDRLLQLTGAANLDQLEKAWLSWAMNARSTVLR